MTDILDLWLVAYFLGCSYAVRTGNISHGLVYHYPRYMLSLTITVKRLRTVLPITVLFHSTTVLKSECYADVQFLFSTVFH